MYHVLIDMDGVLADLVTAAMVAHPGKPYPFPAGPLRGHPGNWSFWDYWDISAEEFWATKDRSFWKNIPIYDWSRRLVALCEDIVGHENVGILTHPMECCDGCFDGKKDWLELHFPHLVERMITGQAKRFCARSRTLLIDDLEKNCCDFVQAGGKTYLWPAHWNFRYRWVPQTLEELNWELERVSRALHLFARS